MKCKINGCENSHYSKGLCKKHYYRLKRTGTTDIISKEKKCLVSGCENKARAKGLCVKHYNEYRRKAKNEQ